MIELRDAGRFLAASIGFSVLDLAAALLGLRPYAGDGVFWAFGVTLLMAIRERQS